MRGGLRVGDVVAAVLGEELLVLDLHPLPRRVAHHAGETARPAGRLGSTLAPSAGTVKIVGELQVPVEEAGTDRAGGRSPSMSLLRHRAVVGRVQELEEDVLGDGLRRLGRLGPAGRRRTRRRRPSAGLRSSGSALKSRVPGVGSAADVGQRGGAAAVDASRSRASRTRGCRRRALGSSVEQRRSRAVAFGLVAGLELARHTPGRRPERRERRVGDAGAQQLRGGAEQGVADLDVCVEEDSGLPGSSASSHSATLASSAAIGLRSTP